MTIRSNRSSRTRPRRHTPTWCPSDFRQVTTCPEKDEPAVSVKRASSSRGTTTACSRRAPAPWPTSNERRRRRPTTTTTTTGTTTTKKRTGTPTTSARALRPLIRSDGRRLRTRQREAGIRRVGVDLVAADRVLDRLALHVARLRQRRRAPRPHVGGVDLEVPAQRGAHVGEAVAVGAEHDVGLGHEPGDRSRAPASPSR